MSRRPATFTQADLGRAIREAKKHGMTVEVLPEGGFLIVPMPVGNPQRPIERRKEIVL